MQRRGRYHALEKERTILLRCESLEPPMSLVGQTRRFDDRCRMTLWPARADMAGSPGDVAEVPLPDSCSAANRYLFDHLVGSTEQREWDGNAKRVGGFQIEDQLGLHRLLDRQIGWLLALENTASIDAALMVRVRKAVSIADQAACHDVLAKWVHRGHRVAGGQCDNLLAPAIEEWITAYDQRAGSQSRQGCEDRIEVALGARLQDMKLQPEGAGRRLQVSRQGLGVGGI